MANGHPFEQEKSQFAILYFQKKYNETRRRSESAYIRQVKTGLSAHRHAHRHTKVKTVYPPVSLSSLGGYKNTEIGNETASVIVKSP